MVEKSNSRPCIISFRDGGRGFFVLYVGVEKTRFLPSFRRGITPIVLLFSFISFKARKLAQLLRHRKIILLNTAERSLDLIARVAFASIFFCQHWTLSITSFLILQAQQQNVISNLIAYVAFASIFLLHHHRRNDCRLASFFDSSKHNGT